MLIAKKLTSKKGNDYLAIFWRFRSGKDFRLNIPPDLARKIVEGGVATLV